MVKTRLLLGCLALSCSFFLSCERKNDVHKVINGLPVTTANPPVLGLAIQQMALLKRDALGIVVPVLNRLGTSFTDFPELSGPDGSSRYTFTLNETHFGTAQYTLQFKDISGGTIDPIQNPASTTTLHTVNFTGTGTSPEFSYSETLQIEFETSGEPLSDKFLTGTSSFGGSGIAGATFTFPSPGASATFTGLASGSVSAVGTDSSGRPLSAGLRFNADRETNGDLAWDEETGHIHLKSNGHGLITTDKERILLD